MGERFKLELLDAIPEGEPVTLYHQGKWFDLCRGPHGPSTGRIGAFKLTKVAGSYWRGDARNAQLQRIYGTAFATKAELDAYLHQLEEAERRDHRKLGREMDLFHVQEEAAGSVFWHPHGWTLWRAVENYIRRRLDGAGYVEVKTPQLYDRVFWERSGHWEKFRENMFTLEAEERHLALKPMNCPGHVQIFNQGLHSYRDLPLRLAEFGSCHRNEPSGALHGIMRVRAFTQDDAHIFCTPEQITAESVAFCELLMQVYQDFGFERRAGEVLRPAAGARRRGRRLGPGRGGAVGGGARGQSRMHAQPRRGRLLRPEARVRAARRDRPRLAVRHAAGRLRPARAAGRQLYRPGRRQAPAGDAAPRDPGLARALHRHADRALCRPPAACGWRRCRRWWRRSPTRPTATPTRWWSGSKRAGVRAEADTRADKIGYKVREHSLRKVPLLLAVGGREQAERTVSLRRLGDTAQTPLSLDAAVALCQRESAPPDL